MRTILITGATGFIGSSFLQYISAITANDPFKIVLLSSRSIDGYTCVLHRNYRFTKEDFTTKGITDIDTVIHIGAYIPKSTAETNAYDENISNVTNTDHLLRNLPSIPRKFVFISTTDVYQQTDKAISEDTALQPSGFYGVCKLFCERMVEQWGKQYASVVQVLRLGHIYGQGEEAYKKLIPETIRNIKSDKAPVIYSAGNEKRSYLHISDCVRAIWSAVQLDEPIGPVNIASAKAYPIKDIIQILVDVSGKNLRPDILYKNIPVRDVLFDNKKMEHYLTVEEQCLHEGLKQQFYNFNNSK